MLDVVIIGTGFSGIGAAIRLRQAGIDNFVLAEREDAIGGTWYVNRYPGAACDVESNLYSFSFAQNPDWRRSFGTQQVPSWVVAIHIA
jgi:cation diffusion facilitator CzcD-associated flavoprotein CzcO